MSLCSLCSGLGIVVTEQSSLKPCAACEGTGYRRELVQPEHLRDVRVPSCKRGHGRMRVEPERLPDGGIEFACSLCGSRKYRSVVVEGEA